MSAVRTRPHPVAQVGSFFRHILAGTAAVTLLAALPGADVLPGRVVATPFQPRPAARGKTLFSRIDPAESGLKTENRYSDPRMWGDLYQEFEGGSIGTGVAIGDYDGDGLPDVFVVSKTESCRLFRNLGHGRFEDVTEKAGVGDTGAAALTWKSGATFVDVNNDGRLDLYVCRFNAPNLLYINQGDGTFREMARAYGLDVTDSSVMASFCDYDRDGWLDVYVATNLLNNAAHPNGQRGYLLHNNRDGTFTNVTERAGIAGETQSHSATWWDFDDDGWPDLYVANDYGVPDKLYHNNRDGTFTDAINQALPHTSFYSMGSDLGDVDNDGRIDFLAADMAATTHFKDQHSIAESRNKAEDPPPGVTVAPKLHRSALYLNTGTGHALEAAYLAGIAASDWTWSVRFEDLDNDGRLDLFITNGFNRDPNPDVHQHSINAETTAERIRIMHDSPVLMEMHLAFRNLGDLEFRSVGAEWGLDQRGVGFGAAFGDLDRDGNLDVVYANYQEGVTFLRNDGDEGHSVEFELRGTVSNRFGIGATVRLETSAGIQVRQLWLARGYLSSSEPVVHFGLGPETRIRRVIVTWPSGLVQVLPDLSAGNRYTVTEPAGPAPVPPSTLAPPAPGQFVENTAASGFALASREEPVDETYVQKLLPIRLNRRGPALAATALANGAHLVAVGGTTQTPATVLLAAPGAALAPVDTAALLPVGPVDDGPLLFLDVDGDGNDDLLVTKGGNSLPAGSPEYQPRLFLGDGHGGFHPAPDNALPVPPCSVGAAAAADFDHTGRLGVFLGARLVPGQYPVVPQSTLLANRGGRFEDVTDRVAPGLRNVGMVTAALWSDVDGDGWPDLLVALDWGTVKYFHNNQGGSLDDWSERAGFAAAGAGWWTSLAAADFNGDGRMDYVAGNVGLNTPYQADADHPVLLFDGDFRGGGTSQLIEAFTEDGKLYPRRSRLALGAAIPAILKRFPRNDAFARATLGEILGEDKLAKARRLAATELRSGVFLSQPDGSYRFAPLPRLAQVSPLQGIVAGDFAGEGRAGIFAVQNSYAPIPSVGRYDTGLGQLLRGDGHGHFTTVPATESGLVVTGDAKALALLDLDADGWPDFLATRNNGNALAFHNHGAAGRHSLRITLRGAPGNPAAIGARVTVEYADGSRTATELAAGSGYFSQSAAETFAGQTDANPIRRIVVRWPSGASGEFVGPFPGPSITLSFHPNP